MAARRRVAKKAKAKPEEKAKPKEREFSSNFRSTKEVSIPEKLIEQVVGQENAVKIIKKAAKQRRHVLLIGSPGCLIGDERVFLGTGAIAKIGNFGSRHLEPISKGVMVGKGHKVAKATVFHSYRNEPIIEIVTESGKSIKGTPNHPLLITAKRYVGKRKIRHVKTKKEIEVDWYRPSWEWRRLDQIKVGDRVAVVSGVRCTIDYYVKTGFARIKRNKYGPKFHSRLPEEVTPSLAALFGYIVGDGWADSNRERVGFVVADDEKDILPQLIAFVKENFGIDPYNYVRIRKDRKMPMHYVEISNQDIYSNLKFLKEKRVPDLILRSGNETVAAFLRWLFTADGTVRNRGRGKRIISLKSAQVELLRDVQILLLRFGIHSRIDGLNSKSGDAPILFISRGHDIIKFNKKIGFACIKKIKIADVLAREAESFARVKKQRSERVVKIIEGGRADVFDIEVPDGHRFIANGIISHNTGKTMLAQAMAELLPSTELEDILVYRNSNDENTPLVKAVRTYPSAQAAEKLGDGQGRMILQKERMKSRVALGRSGSWITPVLMIIVIALIAVAFTGWLTNYEIILDAAVILGVMVFGSAALFTSGLTRRVGALPGMSDINEPKLIVDNTGLNHAPFMDGTGNKAGALFGDVRHDPLQSGGLGTPAHLRVESGAVHRSNKGVLYIDEISRLDPKAQQDLLTALQEKKYSIQGQSEMSSGALVKTEPVPCDFVLVAAGNLQDVQNMHPALRSRIRGYGYEVYMEDSLSDTIVNREKVVQFVAQEVKKDGKIPPFEREAVEEIVEEARRRSGRKGKLTLVLRDLGGLIRAAGDIAVEKKQNSVTKADVIAARNLANPIEAQVIAQAVEYRKDYKVFTTKGWAIGKVNGLAVVGGSILSPGIVMPIVSEVTPASSRSEGKFIPTGRLGKIATEAVKNVSAIIKKHMGRDIANYDMHTQFLQAYEGVEGDSASISVAISIISAMEGIPVDQSVAMTGSLSVRGEVLPVGGVTSKVEAAIESGIKTVILPSRNLDDVYVSKDQLKKVELIPVRSLAEVLQHALKPSPRREEIIKELKKYQQGFAE